MVTMGIFNVLILSTGVALIVTLDAIKLTKETITSIEGTLDDIDEVLQEMPDEMTETKAENYIDLNDCQKGKCTLCTKVKVFKICLEAAVLKQGFSVEIKVNGGSVFKKDVTIPNPPPLCISKIPGIDEVSDLCVTLDNIDLQKRSACAKGSFSAKVGPVKKKINFKIGCFTIPGVDGDKGLTFMDLLTLLANQQENAAKSDTDADSASTSLKTTDSSVWYSMESSGVVSMEQGNSADVTDDMEKSDKFINILLGEFLAAAADDTEIELKGIVKGCSNGKCEFCTPGKFLKLCVEGAILKSEIGFEFSVTVNGNVIFKKEISVANPPPICFNKFPFAKHIANVCVVLYDVNIQQRSACVKVTFKVFTQKYDIKLGCFKIPIASENIAEAEFPESVLN